MVLGNERSTLLPENSFDKILIINSFHEFTFKAEMLADIKKETKTQWYSPYRRGTSQTKQFHWLKRMDSNIPMG